MTRRSPGLAPETPRGTVRRRAGRICRGETGPTGTPTTTAASIERFEIANLTLILVRHGKSDHPVGTSDHDRPLAEKGRAEAAAIGRWLADVGAAPEAALVSSAARTRETWDALSLAADWPIDAVASRGLYNAPVPAIREAVAAAKGTCILVVGHNPGIGEAAAALARTVPAHARFYDYPTGAATILQFRARDWAAAMRAHGDVAGFAVPGDLTGG